MRCDVYALSDAIENRRHPIEREVGAAAEDVAVRRQECGRRPPAERLPLADVGPPVGVDTNRHKMSLTAAQTPASAYVVRSMSRQDAHHGATMDRRTGLSSARARAKRPRPRVASERSHDLRSIIMRGMVVLRFATVLAIAVWIGGLVALGAIAAPAIFDVVALRQVPDARMLAGAIFGEILRRFHLVSYGCGGADSRGACGTRRARTAPAALRAPLWIAALMLAATLYSGLIISRPHRGACSTRSALASRPRACRARSTAHRVRSAARPVDAASSSCRSSAA